MESPAVSAASYYPAWVMVSSDVPNNTLVGLAQSRTVLSSPVQARMRFLDQNHTIPRLTIGLVDPARVGVNDQTIGDTSLRGLRIRYNEMLRYHISEHISAPVAHIVVLDASNPEKCIETLRSLSSSLPSPYSSKQYDASMLFYGVILVHDAVTRPTQLLRSLQSAIPSPSHYIKLVAFSDSREKDIDYIDVLWDIVHNHILSHISATCANLQDHITETRSGFKNQFKYFFGRKPPPDAKVQHGTKLYQHDSIESKIRLMADLAFLVQNYSVAADYYKMVMSDFKSNEHGQLNYASGCEFYSIASSITGGPRVEETFQLAIQSFVGCRDRDRSVRASIWAAEALCHLGSSLSASAILLKASSMLRDVGAAILLESAAQCFLEVVPHPLKRKFAFYIIRAAFAYREHNLLVESHRCYLQGLDVYSSNGWDYAEDHVRIALGRLSYKMGDLFESIQYYLPVLMSGRHSLQTQAKFFEEFKVIAAQSAKSEALSLEVPGFEPSTLKLDNEHTSVPVTATCDIWNSFTSDNAVKDHIALRSTSLTETEAVVGEPLRLSIRAFNPFQMEVTMKEVHLVCSLSPFDEDPVNPFECSSTTITIAPNSYSTVELSVVCHCAGTLTVSGISWIVLETVQGLYNFISPVADFLVFPVTEPMPLLRISLSNHPASLLLGEVHPCTFTLSNDGSCPADHILISNKDPNLIMFQSLPPYADFVMSLENTVLSPGESVQVEAILYGICVGEFVTDVVVKYSSSSGTSRLCHTSLLLSVEPSLEAVFSFTTVDTRGALCLELVNHADFTINCISTSVDSDVYIQATSPIPYNSNSIDIAPLNSSSAVLFVESAESPSTLKFFGTFYDSYEVDTVKQRIIPENSAPGPLVNLQVSWICGTKRGFLHVDHPAIPEESFNSVVVEMPRKYEHNFTTHPYYLAFLLLVLHDMFRVLLVPVQVCVSAKGGEVLELSNCPEFLWRGLTRRVLPPGTTVFKSTCCILRSGYLDIGSSVSIDGNASTPSSIHVSQSPQTAQ